jgi:hypothetical protein
MNIMKKLITLILLSTALISNAQRTMFGGQNNYTTPAGPTQTPSVTAGLILNLDAANSASYAGSGNTWTDLSGTNNIKFYSSSAYSSNANPTFSSDGGGSLVTTGVFGKSISNSGITGAVARSFEAWVKFNSVSQNAVISIGNFPNDGLFELMAFQNNLINHIWGTFTKSTTVLTANTWYHLVITYDGTTNHSVYVNGIKVGTSSSTEGNNRTLNTVNTPIYIGPAATTTWGAFDGKIGALRIYDHEMTSSQVTNNFDVLKSRFGLQ